MKVDMKVIEHIKQDIDKHKSNWRVEVLAGISSFLSLSYIFVVNPAILGEAGMDPKGVLLATVIASGLATLAMGLIARLPFVLAPGLEMNAYIAFVAVAGMGMTWQEGLGIVFYSGALFFILTIRGIRERIIDSIPPPMKFTLAFAVGAFVMAIGLNLSGILIYEGVNLKSVGSLISNKALVLYAGVGIIAILYKLKIPGEVLISIIVCAIFAAQLGLGASSSNAEGDLFAGVLQLNLVPSDWVSFTTALTVLFLVDFYGSVAKFVGMTMNTSIVQAEVVDKETKYRVPRAHQGLLVDGIATMGGAVLGTSSVTTYVESAVGIAAGGRTGLTAIVAGSMMLMVMFLAQWIHLVPVVATSGALVYVAYRLFPTNGIAKLREAGKWGRVDSIVFYLTPVLVVTSFSLDLAMMLGFLVYAVRALFLDRSFNVYLWIGFGLLAMGRLLSLFF